MYIHTEHNPSLIPRSKYDEETQYRDSAAFVVIYIAH
jgi:hypothetical protein